MRIADIENFDRFMDRKLIDFIIQYKSRVDPAFFRFYSQEGAFRRKYDRIDYRTDLEIDDGF